MSKYEHLVVFVTAKDKEQAELLRSEILSKKVAACVNTADVSSMFFWKDKLETEQEVLLIIKTKAVLFDELEKLVKLHHSYEVPEIIALPIVRASGSYLEWIDENTKN